MTKQELVERMQQSQAWVPGKRVKIDFGGEHGVIMLDGAGQKVTEEDGPAIRRSSLAGTIGSSSLQVSSTE